MNKQPKFERSSSTGRPVCSVCRRGYGSERDWLCSDCRKQLQKKGGGSYKTYLALWSRHTLSSGRIVRSNGQIVNDVIEGQRVIARVYRGNYLPVEVCKSVPAGSPLLIGQTNPAEKHWEVRHLLPELKGQVVVWPAKYLFNNQWHAEKYDADLIKASEAA